LIQLRAAPGATADLLDVLNNLRTALPTAQVQDNEILKEIEKTAIQKGAFWGWEFTSFFSLGHVSLLFATF
jgi:hypothetical protein